MAYVSSGSAQTAGSSVFVDTFVDGVDYTAGTSTQVTLSNAPASPNAVWVFFNGVAQHHTEYTVNGNVVSFTTTIPTNVGQIQVQVNTQLAIGVPGEATVGYSTLTSAAKTTLQRKNAIINGNFDIWQRDTSQTTNGYGSADRWTTYFAGTGTSLSVSQQAFTVGQTLVPNEPEWFARHTFVSGTDVATDMKQRQFIEGVRTFAGQTVTVSFYATCATSLDMTVEFAQQFGTGGSPSAAVYVTPQKVSLTPSWSKYELTFDIPSISGKTIGTANDDRLQIHFWFSAGSDNNTRSDTLGLQSGTIDIAQVQVEKGSSATDFEKRHIADELALCQRYYQEIYFEYQSTGISRATGTGTIISEIHTFPEMRATPSGTLSTAVTDYNARKLDDNTTVSDITMGVSVYSASTFAITGTKTSAFTGGVYYGGTFWATLSTVELDAEL